MPKTNNYPDSSLRLALQEGRRKLTAAQGAVKATLRWLVVDVSGQKMALIEGEQVLLIKPVSTAKAGVDCRQDSGGTPRGLHRINAKIGQDAEKGSIFVGRKAIGQSWNPEQDEPVGDDLILSRILTLDGQEEGLNKGPGQDSLARYIYIHGTNHENLIGAAESHGCIRMTNDDIIELFELVSEGDPVVIVG